MRTHHGFYRGASRYAIQRVLATSNRKPLLSAKGISPGCGSFPGLDPSIQSSQLVSFFFRGEFMITFGHFPYL
jgi:hypothetical protein